MHFLAGLAVGYGIWELGIVTILSWIVMIALVENERSGYAILTLIFTALGYISITKAHVLDIIPHSPWRLVSYLLGYFIIGIGWAFIKWVLYVKECLNQYYKAKDRFLALNSVDKLTPELAPKFTEYLLGHNFFINGVQHRDILAAAPRVNHYIDDLVRWGSFWPWSLFWFLISDPLRRAYESIFRMFRGSFQAISDRMFANVEKDFIHPVTFKSEEK